MPKGVRSDHTWPEVCWPDVGESPGALFAPQMPANVLATITENRPIFLTTLQLQACRAKAKRTAKDRDEDHNRRPSQPLSPLRNSARKPGPEYGATVPLASP